MNPSQPARAKTKSECSISEPKFTKLSTGRITKQRLQLTPDALKPNKSKQKHLEIEYSEDDSESSDDDSDDDDYEDKYVERKMKYDGNLNGSKRRSSGEDTRIPRDVKEQKELKAVYEEIKEEEPILSVTPTIKDEVEREFLARLNQFMSERAYPCPKQFWMGLRDG